jgi:hypothetical protein
VCHHLCSHLESRRCSGVFYDHRIQTCTMTSYLGYVQEGEECEEQPLKRYYRRHRCVGQFSFECSEMHGVIPLNSQLLPTFTAISKLVVAYTTALVGWS